MTFNKFPEKKIIVADIIQMTDPKDLFIIREINMSSKHAPGPDGDGIIYREGKKI